VRDITSKSIDNAGKLVENGGAKRLDCFWHCTEGT